MKSKGNLQKIVRVTTRELHTQWRMKHTGTLTPKIETAFQRTANATWTALQPSISKPWSKKIKPPSNAQQKKPEQPPTLTSIFWS